MEQLTDHGPSPVALPAPMPKLNLQIPANVTTTRHRLGFNLLSFYVEENVVNVFASGVTVVEAPEARRSLAEESIYANVHVITSAYMIYRDYVKENRNRMEQPIQYAPCYLHQLVPRAERHAPAVTVIDGHSHSLSFIGGLLGARTVNLGVQEFGQSGTYDALYDHYGIGVTAIKQAVWRAATMI